MTVIANLTEAERVTMAEILRTHPRVRGESEAQHRMSACLLYTSRAHETTEHLVCRLLLEKKNSTTDQI